MSDQDRGSRPFRLGLTMAGAVSAGAYTAGVVDFLLEALEVWSAEQRRLAAAGLDPADWPVPPHRVVVEAMSGTSAGAMTTALAAVAFCRELSPVRRLPALGEDSGNLLYDSWVRKIDIARLLTLDDLADRKAPVRSLLDGTHLATIAFEALQFAPRARPRPYVRRDLPIELFVTNLRGVPYGVSFAGSGGHDMEMHSDHASFQLRQAADADLDPPPPALADFELGYPLPADDPAAPGWPRLAEAALASGAFPVGLPARVLRASPRFYEKRFWSRPVPLGDLAPPDAPPELAAAFRLEQQVVAPLWNRNAVPPEGWSAGTMKFANVDGGFLNNEPFEIVRQALSGGPGRRNPREATEADAAVVMIDPFPTPTAFRPEPWDSDDEGEPPTDILSVLGGLIEAAKQDGRFKAEAVTLVGETFSRFMVAPAALPADAKDETLTSGAAAAFGGFLSEAFRRHDFQLGRRNCQRFLQRHFLLHKDNPVFPQEWVRRKAGGWALPHGGSGPADYLPILPLMAAAPDPDVPGRTYNLNDEVVLPPRPTIDREQLRELKARFDVRLASLLPRLVSSLPVGGFAGWLLRNSVNSLLKDRLVQAVSDWVVADLQDHRVLAPELDPGPRRPREPAPPNR